MKEKKLNKKIIVLIDIEKKECSFLYQVKNITANKAISSSPPSQFFLCILLHFFFFIYKPNYSIKTHKKEPNIIHCYPTSTMHKIHFFLSTHLYSLKNHYNNLLNTIFLSAAYFDSIPLPLMLHSHFLNQILSIIHQLQH